MTVANSSGSIGARTHGFSGWGQCPLDILMIIFEKLKPEDLASCLLVNVWWRDSANYAAQHRGQWQQLAQSAMMNKGLSFRRRSTRPWRDLYINTQLWLRVQNAKVVWKYERSDQDIRYLHVYRDVLIIEKGDSFSRRYHQIKDKDTLVDVTDRLSQDSLPTITTKDVDNRKGNGSFDCDRIIKKLVKEGPFRRFLVLDQDCYYVLDEKNVLCCSKWDANNQRWLDYTLARYYGCSNSISDINVYDGEVYMLLKTGLVFKLDREGRNFIPAQRINFSTTRLVDYSRLLSSNIVLKSVQQVSNLDLPSYSTGKNVMFEKACAVVSVPGDRKFKINVNAASGNVVLEYPNLSCAMQHGEVLLLGFKDGKIEICIPKNLCETGLPERKFFVQGCPGFNDNDPEIVALDVHEDEDSHQLFVATRTSVYRLLITYDDRIKMSVGLRKSFTVEDRTES